MAWLLAGKAGCSMLQSPAPVADSHNLSHNIVNCRRQPPSHLEVGDTHWTKGVRTVHGLQAMDPVLFESYPGYGAISEVLHTEGGRTTIRTPQVVHKARAHLGCDKLAGAELEDDGVEGTAGSHWEQRIFEVCHAPPAPSRPTNRCRASNLPCITAPVC